MEDERSATSTTGEVYDVFLSFRGPDTRRLFGDVLYNTMRAAGIKVYRDDDELSPGQKIETILPAIDNSSICMPVFSKNFASSSWCLREVERMVDLKKEIIPIFYDVTSDDVKLKTLLYKDQLDTLKENHSKDQILRWEVALRKTVKFKGRELKDQSVTEFVDDLVKDLTINLKIKHENVPEYLVGIDVQLESALKLLTLESNDVRMLKIYGIGGSGKTTLAQYIFNKIMDKFACYWFLDDIAGEISRGKTIKSLLEQLLVALDPKVKNLLVSTKSINLMQKNFKQKKVLIVLDNVDKQQQIQNLVGTGRWFGPGSRIIVTTRDDSVLVIEDEAPESSSRSQSTVICALEMVALNSEQSLQLLCWHAFGKDYPEPEYKDHASQVLGSIGGLPLVLKAIGLLLKGNNESFWKEIVAQLKKIVHPDVKGILKISYDNLDIFQQQIFLDIACFFISSEVSNPKYMWDACNLYPLRGLKVLISKSLIKIENGKFWMHDQFKILGREIAWDIAGGNFKGPEQKETMNMLYKKGKNNIVGLQFDTPSDTLTADCFAGLSSLRYLSVSCRSFTSGFQHPLENLKWLGLHYIPANFDMSGLSSSDLVILDLSHGYIDGKWQGWNQMELRCLKVLDLTYCCFLEVTPSFSNMVNLTSLNFRNCVCLIELTEDFSSLKNLTYLCLMKCPKLSRLPESLGKLKSLVRLDLRCTPISSLPNEVGELKKLEHLSLSYSYIARLPETFGGLESLDILDLSYSWIEELPTSIGSLRKLRELSLYGCSNIKRLPESLGDLESLVLLGLSSSSVMALPASIGRLKKLEILKMQESKMDRLPSEMGELHSLRILNLSLANRIRALPDLPQTLTKLHIASQQLDTVPNLSRLSNLTDLTLVDGGIWFIKIRITESHHLQVIGNLLRLESLVLIISNITTLPQDLGRLSQLKKLILGCPSFTCIPQLPTSLKILELNSEHSELNFLKLSYLRYLEILYIRGFSFTTFGELQLPESVKFLSLTGCETQSTSDCIPPLKNLVHLELLKCKGLYEISGLGDLESLKTLDIECCESLRDIGSLSEHVKVTIFSSCSVLNHESNKVVGTHVSKLFGREMMDDEKNIWRLLHGLDRDRSEYLSWWKGSSNQKITDEPETLNDDSSDMADDVVHDLSLLLSSPDRDFLIRNNGEQVQIDSIIKRNTGFSIVLLFSASWCLSSQMFFLLLKQGYRDECLDVFIFVSLDDDDESFKTHFSMMPWLAIPFSDSDKRHSLVQLFKVTHIPHLVVLDKHGKVIRTGLSNIVQGPFPRESYPHPLIKVQRDAAPRNQSLTSLLVHGPYNFVLSPEGNEIPASKLEGKIVGFFFSNPYNTTTVRFVQFHKRLVDVYEKLKKSEENFEIVNVRPSYNATSTWEDVENFLILPMNFRRFAELIHLFEIKNLPALVIIGSNGEILNRNAVDAITEHGATAYPFTMEKLAKIGWEVVGQNEAVWRKHSLRSAMALHDSFEFISSDGSRLPVSVFQGKIFGIYFAQPSQACIEFALDLLDVYENLNSRLETFEVVLAYMQRHASNHNKQAFSQSFGVLPWLSFESSGATTEGIASYFDVSVVPSLVIIGKDGNIVNFNAVHLIRDYGAKAYPFTHEKVAQLANVKKVSREIRNAGSLWPMSLQHDLHVHQLVCTLRNNYICDLCQWRIHG